MRPIVASADAVPRLALYRWRVRMRSLLGRHLVDALIVVLAGFAVVEALLAEDQTPRWATVPLALLWTLPLLFRRRYPFVAPALVLTTLACESLLPDPAVTSSQVNGLALLAAFAAFGSIEDSRSALAGAALGYAALAVIVVVERPSPSAVWPILLFGAAAWAIGRILGERGRHAADLERRALRLEREHERAVAVERATIARELHDVIAHSVSVMTVQAGAARLLLDGDPASARASLVAVEETGRQALGEMRRLLGILRGDEEQAGLTPQPGIADVAALVTHIRGAGLPVDIVVEGEPRELPPGVDLAAYRVVQEALTNALKHGGAARAEVSIRYAATDLQLTIANDGRPPVQNGGRGHGVIGMRERVSLYGGDFHAGARPEGGFVVRARLPIEAAS